MRGTGIRIAVIDSGVHASHPHVGGVAGGVGIREDGTLTEDFVDRLGHGTAVTAAIREKVPDASIIAIKVFWESLATDVSTLVRAIEEAAIRGADVINLSLGTSQLSHRDRLAAAVSVAREHGALIVSANDDLGTTWLPGSLDGVVAVRADWTCDRNGYTVIAIDGRPALATSPYPRDIPGVPRERNVNGVSFAVANASAFVARARESSARLDIDGVFTVLRAAPCAAAV